MVQQNAKNLGLRFKARVQTDMYDDLFARRLAGEKLLINLAMDEAFLKDPSTIQDRGIATKISRWHEAEIEKLKGEIDTQTERLKKAEAKLKIKQTKTAENEKRIASNWIEKYSAKIKSHSHPTPKSELDKRIFPFHYMSMLYLDDAGEKIIAPFRYHMRPHDEAPSFDDTHNGCYNARFNNLKRVAFWKDSLSKRRGLIVVEKFYENVATVAYLKKNKLPKSEQFKENVVVCFEPKGVEYMFIPTLWDKWTDEKSVLYSAALITDDPPPEVSAAGHDRCPIFLNEDVVESWLRAASAADAIAILDERVRPFYEHHVLGAA
jgi:putative SOS response-associated peptidase YedK